MLYNGLLNMPGFTFELNMLGPPDMPERNSLTSRGVSVERRDREPL
jgi:hypothetical protein